MIDPTYPDVIVAVRLDGPEGNVHVIIGRTAKALRDGGYYDQADEFTTKAFACSSPEDVLALVRATVVLLDV